MNSPQEPLPRQYLAGYLEHLNTWTRMLGIDDEDKILSVIHDSRSNGTFVCVLFEDPEEELVTPTVTEEDQDDEHTIRVRPVYGGHGIEIAADTMGEPVSDVLLGELLGHLRGAGEISVPADIASIKFDVFPNGDGLTETLTAIFDDGPIPGGSDGD